MEVMFGSIFSEVKKVEAEGKKKYILSGTLMDDSMNKNFWKVKTEDLDKIASDINTSIPIDLQHSPSDWEMIGSFLSGKRIGNSVFYNGEITDTKAVEKFETGTWNARNMGISPTIKFESIECSVCGKDMRNCGHYRGEEYDGKPAYAIINKPTLVRAGLTSGPAYAPSAGSIETVTLCASLEKLFNKEDENMADETLRAQLDKKDATIEKLEASVKDLTKKLEAKTQEVVTEEMTKLTAEVKTLKEDIETKDNKIKTLAAEKKAIEENLEAADKIVSELKAEKRMTELVEILGDKEVAETIVKKNLSDEEFKAEVGLLKKVKASVKTSGTGSAPTDNGGAPADLVKAEFGQTTEDILKGMGLGQ